jgi:ornithine cyclodeaminase/alanine dehydrogenase-like protein (mu-crystallin family)
VSKLRHIGADEAARLLSVADAADALEAALQEGLDPEADPPRLSLPVGAGELLAMPSATSTHAAVKLVSVGGEPRIQGVCVVFDARTLAPVALVDGVALTDLRTPAVSLIAVRRLALPDARRLVVFGGGPQARAHIDAITAVRDIDEVAVFGRDAARGGVDAAVARADVICCATTARAPLFDGTLVRDAALVVAIGSHEPGAREVDEHLARRAAVVVESRASAMREAGDVIAAGLDPGGLITLSELVGGAPAPADRPRLFKSTGMSWEDAVVASALVSACA